MGVSSASAGVGRVARAREIGKAASRLSVPYRALPEPERLELCRSIVAEELKGFKSKRAVLTPARALRKRFRRVAARDARLFARDVRRIRCFFDGVRVWRYAGKVKGRPPARLAFVERGGARG